MGSVGTSQAMHTIVALFLAMLSMIIPGSDAARKGRGAASGIKGPSVAAHKAEVRVRERTEVRKAHDALGIAMGALHGGAGAHQRRDDKPSSLKRQAEIIKNFRPASELFQIYKDARK